ncbi:Hypothetical protein A7982_06146 [Minicystis rosea]|nr:Hypothetical protein A7982_06146 [Minicystis rosea]
MRPSSRHFLEAILDALAGAPIERAHARWSSGGWFSVRAAPWHAWLLVALARQLSRQRWLMRVWRGPLQTKRHAKPDEHVPGMPGWQYYFHGAGLCLTGPDGEVIDVDDHGDEGLTIDPYFFAARLRSLRDPALPERRLRAFLPTDGVVAAAIKELAALGALQLDKYEHTFRLQRELEEAAEELAAIDFSSPDVGERWMEHMGDHLLTDDARAHEQREVYVRYLFAGLDRNAHVFIEPLEAVLSPAELVETCSKVIGGSIGPATGCAIERLRAHPEYPFCTAVVSLLHRADPARHHPYAVYQAVRYLFERGVERPLAQRAALAFAEVEVVDGYKGNPYLGDLALLLLDLAPAEALPVLRRALRSSTPMVQSKVSVALALLDQPWCHRELLVALEEATTFEASSALRSALIHTSAEGARDAVTHWLKTHVRRQAQGPGYTWEEIWETNADASFAHEAEALRPWAEAARASIDPDFDRMIWA